MVDDEDQVNSVLDLVETYVNEGEPLSVLSLTALNEAVSRFVEANDTEAVSVITKFVLLSN